VRDGAVFAEGPAAEVFYDPGLVGEAGLRPPQTVAVYLEFCRDTGITPTERPLRRSELVGAIRAGLAAGSRRP
jgi:hypothetical protein